MKIGIDARMFGPFHSGLGRTNQQHILALQKLDTDHEFVLFLNDDSFDSVPEHDNFKKVRVNIGWYGWEEQVKFTKIIKREDVDLMHFPHWNVPLSYNEPFVVTIHDLIMQHYRRPAATTLGPFTYWIKDKIARIVLKHAAKASKQIITPSVFTKNDVSKTLLIDPEKIIPVYEGVTKEMGKSSSSENILEKYSITKPYVLYVGNAYPHKNLEGLLKAWNLFEETNSEYQLVLVGKENHFYKNVQESTAAKSCNNVIFTGFVPDAELHALYKQSSLYVFPSLYEGFGLPPLEAMAHGVPVISSDRSCLPEILGSGALFVDPENAEQFSDMIEKVLSDRDVQYDLKNNAKMELEKYDWGKYAKEILKVYERCK